MIKGRYQPKRGSRIEGMRRPPRVSDPFASGLASGSGLYYSGKTSPPVDPVIGSAYYDVARAATYVWDGFQWNALTQEQIARTPPGSGWTSGGTWTVSSGVTYNNSAAIKLSAASTIPANEVWIMPINGGTP